MCDFMEAFCAELFLSSEETGGENRLAYSHQ